MGHIKDRVESMRITRQVRDAAEDHGALLTALVLIVGVPAIIALVIALGFAGVLYYGWALQIMWGWFITPLGAPAISTVQAAGIIATFAMAATLARRGPLKFSGIEGLRLHGVEGVKITGLHNLKIINDSSMMPLLCTPLLTLGFGWVLHAMM